MPHGQTWFEILSKAAQQRSIQIDISPHGLADEEVIEIESWVNQHLGCQKPLTSEELAIWNAIEKKIKTPLATCNAQELVSIPLDEEAIQHVICDLELSTKQIKAKTRILENQAAILFKPNVSSDHIYRDDTLIEASIQRQREIERQQMFFLSGEIQSQLNESIHLMQDKLDRCYKVIRPTANEKLKVDDRHLELLETQASSLNASTPINALRTQSMLNALQMATILSLKARLDRIYLQELKSGSSQYGDHDSANLLKQTQDDLQSLYTEIEDVASMLINKEHGAKLREIQQRLEVARKNALAQDVSQVIAKLTSLASSTEQLAARYEYLHAHREALAEILSHVTEVPQQPQHESLSRKTPTSDSQTHKLDALLRHLNIHINDTSNTDMISNIQQRTTSLLSENKAVLDTLVTNAKTAAERSSTRLDTTLNTSNDHLIEAKQRTKVLDDHIALAKSGLEAASRTADTHRSFIEKAKNNSR